jgi:colicin import membrane protein
LARKKDKDLYEEQKANLLKALKDERLKQEQELSAREASVVAAETELGELRSKVASFPTELSNAVERAGREALQQAEARARLEEQLRSKEVEGDKRVAELKITALEETVKRQLAQIEALTRKLEESNVQVQAIAVKAIEGASNARALSTINEIAMEQAKNIRDKR